MWGSSAGLLGLELGLHHRALFEKLGRRGGKDVVEQRHRVDNVGLTEVVFAVLLAWLMLGELPSGLQLVGGALIMVGIALVRIDQMRLGGTAPDRL